MSADTQANNNSQQEKQQVIDKTTWPQSLKNLLSSNGSIDELLLTKMFKNKLHPLMDLTNEEHHQWSYDLGDLLLQSSDIVNKDNDSKSEDDGEIDKSINKLNKLFVDCRGNTRTEMSRFPMMLYLGIKLAESYLTMKKIINHYKSNNNKLFITVIFAMYNENNRMKSSKEYKNGENFVRLKVKQLDWLFKEFIDTINYQLIAVDDGCPNNPNSGEACNLIIQDELKKLEKSDKKQGWDKISVKYLQQVIDKRNEYPEFNDLQTTKDSRKGGSVQFGFRLAIDKYKADNSKNTQHICFYTDSDTSADLGQSGLFLQPLVSGKNIENKKNNENNENNQSIAETKTSENEDNVITDPVFAFADRYEKGVFDNGEIMGFYQPNYVVISVRHFLRGKLLPPLKNVLDSQCGYKAIKVEVLSKIYESLKSRTFGFDMELFCCLGTNPNLVNINTFSVGIPLSWTESAKESSFWVMDPNALKESYCKKHFSMIQDMVKIHQLWFSNNENNNNNAAELYGYDPKWVDFIMKLEWKDYFQICKVLYSRYVKDQSSIDMATFDVTLDELKALLSEEIGQGVKILMEKDEKK